MDGGTPNGKDSAGLYSVTTWSDDLAFSASKPFAMDVGSLDRSLLTGAGYDSGADSYYVGSPSM